MEKISIIIPAYNVEKYLKKCVNSVIKQTYKNLEIILVDDGSTDNSGKICDELLELDNRIKVFHKENGGAASARNLGLLNATGDIIAFLDSDDYIDPEFYEYLYDMLKRNDADIAEGDFLRIPENLFDKSQEIINEENEKRNITEEIFDNYSILNILYGVKEPPYVKRVVLWNKLYKKEILNNIQFPEGKLYEDEYTTHKFLFNAKKIVSSNKVIYGYIQTPVSVMRTSVSQKRIKYCLGASLDAIDFFTKNGFNSLIYKIYMRYLENCIELSGKINQEDSTDKNEKLEFLENNFIEKYELEIDTIENKVQGEYENEALNILKRAYKQVKEQHNLYDFWEELKILIGQ